MALKKKITKNHFKKIMKFLVLKALQKVNLTDYELLLIKNIDVNNYSVTDHNILHLLVYNTLDNQEIALKLLNKEISKFEQKRFDIINNKEKQLDLF